MGRLSGSCERRRCIPSASSSRCPAEVSLLRKARGRRSSRDWRPPRARVSSARLGADRDPRPGAVSQVDPCPRVGRGRAARRGSTWWHPRHRYVKLCVVVVPPVRLQRPVPCRRTCQLAVGAEARVELPALLRIGGVLWTRRSQVWPGAVPAWDAGDGIQASFPITVTTIVGTGGVSQQQGS
jgi:hypothetical protein